MEIITNSCITATINVSTLSWRQKASPQHSRQQDVSVGSEDFFNPQSKPL